MTFRDSHSPTAASLDSELAAARAAVGEARLQGDPGAEAAARARVHYARVALGATGGSWWEDVT